MDVCDGLIYLHSEGFTHGDLKGVCLYLFFFALVLTFPALLL